MARKIMNSSIQPQLHAAGSEISPSGPMVGSGDLGVAEDEVSPVESMIVLNVQRDSPDSPWYGSKMYQNNWGEWD